MKRFTLIMLMVGLIASSQAQGTTTPQPTLALCRWSKVA
jgi:hypothetical protein